MDTVDLYERALDRTGRVVESVRREQFQDPTPCGDWDVEKLLDHIIGGCMTFGAGGSGEANDAINQSGFAADDHVVAFQQAAKSALEAFRAPGALESTFVTPWGDTPGSIALHLALADAAVHGWDLATATGQEATVDDDVAEFVYEGTTSMMEPKGKFPRGDSFGEPVDVPDDAPIADKMLAYLGRKP